LINSRIMVAIVLALVVALIVHRVLVQSRMHNRSADQKILLHRSHQN